MSCENFKFTLPQTFVLQTEGREAFAKFRDIILPTGSRSYCFTVGKAKEIWPKAAQKLPGSAQEPNGQSTTFQVLFSIKGKSLIPHTLSDSHGALEQIPSSAGFLSAGVSQQPLWRSASTRDIRLCTDPAKHLSTWLKLNMRFCVAAQRRAVELRPMIRKRWYFEV